MRMSWRGTVLPLMRLFEVIWNGFDVQRNKRIHGGYQLVGYTDGGRKLKLIVYERRKALLRVITGWDV